MGFHCASEAETTLVLFCRSICKPDQKLTAKQAEEEVVASSAWLG